MQDNAPSEKARRTFLKGVMVAAGGLSIAPGIRLFELGHAKPDAEAVTSAVRWGMLIDTTKCDDCDVCVKACHHENGIQSHGKPATDPQWIRKVNVTDKQTGHSMSLPVMCQHCETAPCADVCPTGASYQRPDGIVLVNRHTCIGCRYCMMACPYKARSFEHEDVVNERAQVPRGKGTVESCTMCVHRVDKGEIPACVEACGVDGHQAMVFGDLKDPESEISKKLAQFGGKQIRADLGLNTGVRYQGI